MNHADAIAELAKDFPRMAEIVLISRSANRWSYGGYPVQYIDDLLTLAATEHAQRKQLEAERDTALDAVKQLREADCLECNEIQRIDQLTDERNIARREVKQSEAA